MRTVAFEFKGIEWLNQKLSTETTILSNLRSNALLNNKNIILSDANITDINYRNLIMNSKIDYIVIKNFDNSKKYFFNNCKLTFIAQSPNFLVENRNFLNRNTFYSVSIFKLANKSFKNCIKD
jgi:hypothetical protein